MQVLALVHIIRRACHARLFHCWIAIPSVRSRGRYEDTFSLHSPQIAWGASEWTRFEGRTVWRVCLSTAVDLSSVATGEDSHGVSGMEGTETAEDVITAGGIGGTQDF